MQAIGDARLRILLAIGVSLAYISYAIYRGPLLSPDSNTYKAWADILIAENFNYSAYLEKVGFVVSPVFYLAWVTLVALISQIWGASWAAGIVAVNCAASLLIVWMTLKLSHQENGNRWGLPVAALFLVLSYDIWSWIPFVLSDIVFVALSLIVLFLLSGAASSKKAMIWLSGGLIFSLTLIFYRPTAPPMVALAITSLLTYFFVISGNQQAQVRRARILAIVILASAIAIAVGHAYLMENPQQWPAESFSRWINFISQNYNKGQVIMDRPETFHSPPKEYIDFLLLSLDKFFQFFAFSAQGFSRLHQTVNWLIFLPAWILVFPFLWRLFSSTSSLSPNEWWIGWLCLWMIFFFAFYHALQLVDYDWRYRAPIMPPLIILATLGFGRFRS